jgi:hypothetical protein
MAGVGEPPGAQLEQRAGEVEAEDLGRLVRAATGVLGA